MPTGTAPGSDESVVAGPPPMGTFLTAPSADALFGTHQSSERDA